MAANQYQILDDQSLAVLYERQRIEVNLNKVEAINNRIFLTFEQINDSGQKEIIVLNDKLEVVSDGIQLTGNDQVFSTRDKDLVARDNTLDIYQHGELLHSLSLNNQLNYQFFNNSKGDYFIYSTGSTFSSTASHDFFLMTDVPLIGPQMNGPWYDLNFPNQGLAINHGQRTDGSQYVFLTFYLYRNGEPLWLAGDQNYLPGQPAITLDLFEYSGIDFLATNDPPDQTPFGSLTLSFSACDGLTGSLQYSDQTQLFDFNRVDDTSFSYRCVMP